MANVFGPSSPARPDGGPKKRYSHFKRKGRSVERDDGDGNWLVSYADMMTLLLGFFVILTAYSTPDPLKLERLRASTAKATGGKYDKPYEAIAKQLGTVFQVFELHQQVLMSETDRGLQLTIRGALFFDQGASSLNTNAKKMVTDMARILLNQARDFRIVVEGHTDDSPIGSKFFPTNWELSGARASSVVRLFESVGFPRENLRALALADTVPVAPNRDATGKAVAANQSLNRRIVIRVEQKLPDPLKPIRQ